MDEVLSGGQGALLHPAFLTQLTSVVVAGITPLARATAM